MKSYRRTYGRALAVVASCAFAFGATATPPLQFSLVKDLDMSPGSQGSEPADFVEWNGRSYFGATTVAAGAELFSTDGTAGGTRLTYDFVRGAASSGARPLGVVDGRLIVEADDGVLGRQLWAFAGEGSPAVRLSTVPVGGARFDRFGAAGGRLLLGASWRGPLWATDGTAAGTHSLLEAFPGGGWGAYGMPCRLDDVALFVARDPAGAYFLMRTDGTVAGTVNLARLTDRMDAHLLSSLSLNGQCQFLVGFEYSAGGTWTLWTSQGTAAATAPVASDAAAVPLGLVAAGGVLHIAQRKGQRYQLLRNVPGSARFDVVFDVIGSSSYQRPVAAAGRIGVTLTYEEPGVGWRHGFFLGDGTAGSMQRVYPTQPGQPALPYGQPVALNDAFVVQSSDDGVRIDAAAGTVSAAPPARVFDVVESVPFGARRIGAGVGANGIEPWISDGSAVGTRQVVDLYPATADGLARLDAFGVKLESAANGNVLFFTTPGAFGGSRYALWRTDGTPDGTRKLPPALLAGTTARSPVPFDDGVAFLDADDGFGGLSGVVRATSALDAVERLSTVPNNTYLMSSGGGLVFLGYSPVSVDLYGSVGGAQASVIWPAFGGDFDTRPIGRIGGAAIFLGGGSRGIWRSDGTAPGTFAIADSGWESVSPSKPMRSQVFRNKLYFVNCRSRVDCSLASTDGTVAGTAVVHDLPPASSTRPAEIDSFAVVGDRLVYTLSGYAMQWWASDGTPSGSGALLSLPSSVVSPVAVVGGVAHLAFDCVSPCKYRYAVSDGTPAGTRFVDMPPGLEPVRGVMAALGRSALFSCRLPQTGLELCVVDADGGDARLLDDIHPGPEGSNASLLGVTVDAAYVKLDDGVHGYEPWVVRELPERIFASGFESRVAAN